MTTTRRIVLALACSVASIAAPASAQVFDFARLVTTGPYLATIFAPTNGGLCTSGDRCSTLGGTLDFLSGGLVVKTSGFNGTTAKVAVQDKDNGYNGLLYGPTAKGAGLGVYSTPGPSFVTSDDNITSGERLRLSFASVVKFDWVGLRNEGHITTGWAAGKTFEYSVDGGGWTSALLPGTGATAGKFDLGLIGTNFDFRFGGADADQYYVAVAAVSAVPEPASITLLAFGLAGLGLVARRRRRSA